MQHVAVVGASLAGTSAVEALREAGYDGAITLIDGAAEVAPDRPPLSKQVLVGSMEPDAARLPVAGRLDELGVDLRLGAAATALRADAHELDLADGTTVGADGFVIATGSRARRLDTDLAGVHVLRTLDDSLAIKADLDRGGRRVVVIGAGFIGAEVASSCRSLGLDVTMIEAAPLPLQRVLPSSIGEFIAELHRGHGVDVRLGVGVDALEGGGGGTNRVQRVRLTDGSVIDADVVVAGIGVTPEVGWLDGSGLTLDDGVVCDETCLAADDVVAAGDVARWFNPRYGETMRVEQWENAIEQGGHAARRLLGDTRPYSPVPWFWSDQYDRKIQLAGRVAPGDSVRVVDGSIEEQRFVALFERAGTCTAVLGVNRPRHVVQLRLRMTEGELPFHEALARFDDQR